MLKKIEVTPYNPEWPHWFADESRILKEKLGSNFKAIHHVGSTSVPGLCAKPFIDIIMIVEDIKTATNTLESLGFISKGEINIPFRYYFSKKTGAPVHLHVYTEMMDEIELNLRFRDYLRAHDDARDEYAQLKTHLLADEASHSKKNSRFTGYNLGKDAFIRRIVKASGFNGVRLLRCTHHSEWENYHRIRETQLWVNLKDPYDRNHPTILDEAHYHFVLYHGVEIVSVAHVEFLGEKVAVLRSLATDKVHLCKGYASALLNLIQKWVKSHGVLALKMHAYKEVVPFYKKRGFSEMQLDEPSIVEDAVDLGKIL